jgi:hypothetical protein
VKLSKKDAAVIIGALTSLAVAVLASLYGLGEHAPGAVMGLLMAAAMLAVNVFLWFDLRAAHAQSVQQAADSDALAEKAVTAMLTVGERLSAFEKSFGLDARMERMEAERKEREDHANAGTSGQG